MVSVLTFGSIFLILLLWFRIAQSTILWMYSFSMTGFLIFMYLAASNYKPVDDGGFRPEITVVVPAKNEEQVIESVIRTAFKSDYPSSKMEVIVVDDGSTDRTWERMQRVKLDPELSDKLVLIRHERNYGKRVALASGIAVAQGEIIVCVDSDSFVDRDAIKLLVQPFRDSKVTAVSGHGEAANKDEGFLPRLQHYWYAEMFRLMKGMESRLGCVSCCSGMLAAYRRSAILPIVNEWLNEKLVGERLEIGDARQLAGSLGRGLTSKLIKSPGEDRILTAYALSARDAKVVYQSNAVVYTIVPKTFKQFLKQQLRWNRAWIHGSLLASRFMWRKSLLSSLVFYLYQFLTFLSPAVVILWLVVKPLQGQWMGAVGFIGGTIYIGFLHGLNTRKYLRTTNETVPYRMIFVFVSFFVTLTVLLYGWATPWKMGWITRTGSAPTIQPAALPQTVPAEAVVA